MRTVLVTGSAGFIGRHLVDSLDRDKNIRVVPYDIGSSAADLECGLAEAEVIFHFAGVNRPQNVEEYQSGNVDFTRQICSRLRALGRRPLIVISSSIQATLDNPYGRSKLQAEQELRLHCTDSGSAAIIFRLPNVFGKGCRPNYNSVVATFCHNIAHDLAITISDPARELELVYVDDVVTAFLETLTSPPEAGVCAERQLAKSFQITLGELAARIHGFRESRKTLELPSFADKFTRCLYATYLSYLEGHDFTYSLDIKTDNRGRLAEFMKSAEFGQIFISSTKPGITRGNHYHHTKTEKFLVVEGEAVIRFRKTHALGPLADHAEIIEHRVNGAQFKVVDIPPGYTHSIENVGPSELITLFWSSEIFDPQRPDTILLPVQH